MTMSVVTSVSTVGSKKLPPCAARLPPVTTLAPFLTESAMCASPFSTGLVHLFRDADEIAQNTGTLGDRLLIDPPGEELGDPTVRIGLQVARM
jgi:hypothetical protein